MDTRAEVDVIPYSTFRKVAKTSNIELRKPKARLNANNGEVTPIKVVRTLECQNKETLHNLDFFITSIQGEPVLSIPACKERGLIKFGGTVDCEQEDVEAFTSRIKKE